MLVTTGQMAVEDYQVVAPKFFADVRSQGIRRILLDWREFRGWSSKEAPTITFFNWIESRSLFDRIAMVFHDGVRNEVDKFLELFRNPDKDVRLFQPEQYEAALDWLKGDVATDTQE
ncbi:MAG: STAS/SEC14 domain-containing protein [Planctomycetota bacterium]|nr:STAS/SEC14 domain-containing protein [Planctomycetota bacterium]